MRKTGNRLLAVLAAVSMTVSLLPVNAVTAEQTDKAQSVQKVTTAQTGGKAQSVQAADSLKKASKAPVTFSEASGTYKDAFSLKLQGADTDTAIYYTTDGSDPSDPDNTARIAYADSGISITDRKNDENVLSAIDPILFDAVNVKGSSDQKSFVSTISAPDKSKVDKCTVIKAAAQHEDGTYSDVVTNTYFVGDMAEHIDGISESCKAAGKDLAVMSISMDADDLFDSAKGIYVKGDTFDKALKEYLDGGGKVDWDASDLCRKLDANYKQKGKGWERSTHIDYFESNGTDTKCQLQQDCGIRIQGNYSRSDYQKSFRLYARQDYGPKNFKYAFWDNAKDDEGNVIDKYKKIVLRNGGNCAFTTKCSDSYWQSLLEDLNCDNQSARPCVVYLNGEYWGVYVLQDDFCGAYMENKHGVNKDNVVVYKGDAEAIQPLGYKLDEGELPEGVTDEDYYFKDLESFMSTHSSLENQSDYDEFAAMVDEDSMIDYFATEVWINNKWDWPGKNWSMWKTTAKDDTNPYADGKWRFMVYDVEFGGISGSGDASENTIRNSKLLKTGTADEKSVNYDKPHVRSFALMMTNKNFRDKFIARLESFTNGMFEKNRATTRLDQFKGMYQPILDQFFERFNTFNGMTADKAINGESWNTYGSLQAIREFLNRRSNQIPKIVKYVRNYYGDPVDVSPSPKPSTSPESTNDPSTVPTPAPSAAPSQVPAQQTASPVSTQNPSDTGSNAQAGESKETLKDGTVVIRITDAKGKVTETKYQTKAGIYRLSKNNSLCYLAKNNAFLKNKTSVTIKDTEKINGKTLKITAVEKGTFKGLGKLKKVMIGKNVTTIGNNAFSGCKNLKNIVIKSTQLKKVGKNAIKGIAKGAQITCPKAKKKAYKKLFTAKTGFVKKTMKLK